MNLKLRRVEIIIKKILIASDLWLLMWCDFKIIAITLVDIKLGTCIRGIISCKFLIAESESGRKFLYHVSVLRKLRLKVPKHVVFAIFVKTKLSNLMCWRYVSVAYVYLELSPIFAARALDSYRTSPWLLKKKKLVAITDVLENYNKASIKAWNLYF